MAKLGELRKKLKVYEIVSEEEFKRDPEAIKIGTKWVVAIKGTKTKPMIKARMVGKEFDDDTKKGHGGSTNRTSITQNLMLKTNLGNGP